MRALVASPSRVLRVLLTALPPLLVVPAFAVYFYHWNQEAVADFKRSPASPQHILELARELQTDAGRQSFANALAADQSHAGVERAFEVARAIDRRVLAEQTPASVREFIDLYQGAPAR